MPDDKAGSTERVLADYREKGFVGEVGFGDAPAILVVDLILGFTRPESPLGSDLDSVVGSVGIHTLAVHVVKPRTVAVICRIAADPVFAGETAQIDFTPRRDRSVGVIKRYSINRGRRTASPISTAGAANKRATHPATTTGVGAADATIVAVADVFR